MNWDEFKEALRKLRQLNPELPVIIYDPDMSEKMEVARVSVDLNGQVTIIAKRR